MSQRIVQKSSQAKTDLRHIARYIAEDNLSASLQFIEQAEATFNQLAAMPLMGYHRFSSLPKVSNLLAFPISSQFKNYLIIYKPLEGGILVVRVMQGAQNIEAILSKRPPSER